MADFYEYSTPELVRLLGSRFKEYRMRCNLTQKEVAEQSGYGDYRVFTKVFKKNEGITPSQYRREFLDRRENENESGNR